MQVNERTNHDGSSQGKAFQISVSREASDPEWDAFVAQAPGGDHVQTSLWGQIKSLLGWKAIRVKLVDAHQILAGAQLLYHPIAPAVSVGYVTKGPVGVCGHPSLEQRLIHEVHKLCRSHSVRYLIVQPPNNGQALALNLPGWGYRESPTDTSPTASVIVDLSLDLEALLADMKRQNRQNIRRAEREGIRVREGKGDDLEGFYRNYQETGKRQGFQPYPRQYFTRMWEVLRPHGYINLIVSERNGESISGLLIVPFGDTVIAKHLGWSGQYAGSRPNEAVFWGAITWVKSHGYHYFDLQGIEPEGAKAVLAGQPLPEALLHSPTFMKLQFGGEVRLFPSAFEYIDNPLLAWSYYHLYPWLRESNLLSRIRNQARKTQVAA